LKQFGPPVKVWGYFTVGTMWKERFVAADGYHPFKACEVSAASRCCCTCVHELTIEFKYTSGKLHIT
jgi:hypothetical protein